MKNTNEILKKTVKKKNVHIKVQAKNLEEL